ncbi:hypothetical protein EMIHUDRAFT_452776 [Emiliania huxleyi CCMP1516]|uniref:Uncharacterized protein n=2 Tax=Emiliania huxleyi TaxID=2903 RepID=A0A0D3IFI1_EMIH1|nr:hypothetical protein EMIHUDRAFT_452776 [Emiliania huxleyi CCMP1516]EOD10016.1 hypothetical protein EMIHUDRAFT_452776 [Emiliania huxleyi CCMP1516]|eukprot:XP_005762445.1 hypothetical protein EMIHUDRAFT_452776 [Emiliania huxleyi CCMP1516]
MPRCATMGRAELVSALGDEQGSRGLRQRLLAAPSAASSAALVGGLAQCVSSFRPDRHALLVDAVLSLHWRSFQRPLPSMPAVVLQFVEELVSAAPAFLRQCISALTHSFLPTLAALLRGCPMGTDFVFESLRTTFPHKRRDAHAHVTFLRHCLAVLRYSPALLKRVVGLLVARMVELDVEIALQQRHLEEAEGEEDDEPIFEVDLGDSVQDELAKMRKNADKLDGMMALMFEFIAETCGQRRSAELPDGTGDAERLLHALLVAFHESLLYTHKCRCVQFLLFFACSFSPTFTDAFLGLLLRQVVNEQIHSEARIASAAYAASFLARASFVPLPAGALYLLCYKHAALLAPEAAEAREATGALVGRLIGGALNPLKFCQEAVLIEFERLGLVPACTAIVAANEGTAVGSRDCRGGQNRLDDFFPFDPLLLKVSSGYVQPLYQVWTPSPARCHAERESEKSALSESLASDASEVVGRSLQGMSLTPAGHTPIDDMEALMQRRFAEQGQLLLQY